MTGISDLHNDIPTSSSMSQGPGRLVRQARETAKLTIEDLAAQIKLARYTLDAIERDDFAQLNEPVYVRGYYRKLAKVLPVGEAELLAAYERVAGHKAPPPPSKLILAGGPELGSGRRISLKLAAAIIVLGLVIGALAFWGKNHSTELPAVSPATGVSEAPAASFETVTPAPAPAGEVPAVSAAVQEPAAATPPAASSPAAESSPQAAIPSGGPGALSMQFSGSSWTEVKDATGKVLLSGLVENGSNQALDGKPPFSVFLGNAPAVRITYNGQVVDMTPFRRGDNTARITLP